jgi:site-specific DNA-methyltransferase (adenine-specific)
MITKGLFSCSRLNWKTPQKLYEELNKEFNFDFDPCPPDPKFNGLTVDWGNRNFVNPPYGRGIINWIRKGYRESKKGKLVVFLIPARTDTIWFQHYVFKADQIYFLKGRLKFDDAENSAPFPSCIAIFTGKKADRMKKIPKA